MLLLFPQLHNHEIMHIKGEILVQKGVHFLILHQWYPKMYCKYL